MKKRKSKAADPAPAGKRRRSKCDPAKRGARVLYEHGERARLYAYHVIAPTMMAAVARRLGSSSVSPRDFYCGCAPSFKDGLPMCERKRPGCRFAERPEPEAIAARETRGDESKYDYHWSVALLGFRGAPLRRKRWARAGSAQG